MLHHHNFYLRIALSEQDRLPLESVKSNWTISRYLKENTEVRHIYFCIIFAQGIFLIEWFYKSLILVITEFCACNTLFEILGISSWCFWQCKHLSNIKSFFKVALCYLINKCLILQNRSIVILVASI